MKVKYLAKIERGQDGVVWDRYLFRFKSNGVCCVYELDSLKPGEPDDPPVEEYARFGLDKHDILSPHCNAVMFGNEYYDPDDEFPLLYANIYNNHGKTDNPLRGLCCVYRLHRAGNTFSSTLVQLIEIGFADDSRYWISSDETKDARPYGNFTIDRETDTYYAFVMRGVTPAALHGIFPSRFRRFATALWMRPTR